MNLIYPNVCGICEKICQQDLCKKCELMLNDISKCKVDYYQDKKFDKHLYLFEYNGIIREKIINYKFNDKPYIYKAFTQFILKNKKTHEI